MKHLLIIVLGLITIYLLIEIYWWFRFNIYWPFRFWLISKNWFIKLYSFKRGYISLKDLLEKD